VANVQTKRRAHAESVSRVEAMVSAYFAARPFQHAASLSYYTLLSMAPLVIVLLAIGGYVFDETAIRVELIHQMNTLIGHDGAAVLQTIMEHAHQSAGSGLATTLVGFALMVFGAAAVFAELQGALNEIWQVEADSRSAFGTLVRVRLQSFAMVLGTAFLLLVSLVLTALIASLQRLLPTAGVLWGIVDALISIALLAAVFALLFKYVPDVTIRWRDTWFGAALTAVLFTLGKLAIGIYLGRASVGSAYGAAGSLVVFMVWVYYGALIFFFGAIATKTIAHWRGSPLRPSSHARWSRRDRRSTGEVGVRDTARE
jgi:membrane protein